MTEQEQTGEKETTTELQDRTTAFLKEYGELVTKHQIDFATYPVFVPSQSEPGSFKVVIQNTPVDMTKLPQKSPFIAEEGK